MTIYTNDTDKLDKKSFKLWYTPYAGMDSEVFTDFDVFVNDENTVYVYFTDKAQLSATKVAISFSGLPDYDGTLNIRLSVLGCFEELSKIMSF